MNFNKQFLESLSVRLFRECILSVSVFLLNFIDTNVKKSPTEGASEYFIVFPLNL